MCFFEGVVAQGLVFGLLYECLVYFVEPLGEFAGCGLACFVVLSVVGYFVDEEEGEYFDAFRVEFKFFVEVLGDGAFELVAIDFLCLASLRLAFGKGLSTGEGDDLIDWIDFVDDIA